MTTRPLTSSLLLGLNRSSPEAKLEKLKVDVPRRQPAPRSPRPGAELDHRPALALKVVALTLGADLGDHEQLTLTQRAEGRDLRALLALLLRVGAVRPVHACAVEEELVLRGALVLPAGGAQGAVGVEGQLLVVGAGEGGEDGVALQGVVLGVSGREELGEAVAFP